MAAGFPVTFEIITTEVATEVLLGWCFLVEHDFCVENRS